MPAGASTAGPCLIVMRRGRAHRSVTAAKTAATQRSTATESAMSSSKSTSCADQSEQRRDVMNLLQRRPGTVTHEEPPKMPVAMPPRQVPRRPLGESAAAVMQDVEDLQNENDRLRAEGARLQRALDGVRDETETLRKITGAQIAALEAQNAAQRDTIDGLADRLAGLKANLHLLRKACDVVAAELPADLAKPKEIEVNLEKIAEAV